ncbi:EamA family transporter [Paracoccus sp. S-4012]|uniref:aromatic amino acid exporter YddG n=1 Tax=Paracoccus sp. S-4012 TaxID=2665648 RepID=UPI0012AF039F|nr:EamA family transporter [Paracoccus sp. S-4012]MRX50915.1 EamA family transporter [Paracoccus sp. S-4012]
MPQPTDQRRATATGFMAVALWSLLALLTVRTAPVPPMQLAAMSFAIGGTVCLGWAGWRGELGTLRHVPLRAYLWSVAGLFLYHALYFAALRLAPPAQAGLVAYLWPLLIVLLSGLLPGQRLTGWHVAGAGLAFAGTALLLAGRGGGAAPNPALGLALAAGCAVIWSGYSLGLRLFAAEVPAASTGVACLGTALLAGLVHLAVEPTLRPEGAGGWLAVLALGAGPVGAAFYMWEIGMKRGNLQLLGTASYAAPVLSTLALIAAGAAEASPVLVVAAGAVAGGALLASRRARRLA